MKRLIVCLSIIPVDATQLTKIVVEGNTYCAQVRCLFADTVSLLYNPGFIVPVSVPRFFKKKYFFCARGTVSSALMKQAQQYMTTEWSFFVKPVVTPTVGVLLVCAYDPVAVTFSWLSDGMRGILFYFTKNGTAFLPALRDDSARLLCFL